jgi:monoterpene epsilon-lactone hydrolase
MAIDDEALKRVEVLFRDVYPLQEEATIDDWRRELNTMHGKIPMPDDLITERVDADGVSSLWISAPGVSQDRVVLLCHGGGCTMGTAHGYREFGYRLSRAADARVLVPDFRLAPEHPFPIPHEDCTTVYRWLAATIDPSRIVVAGDSAGGGLAVALVLTLRDAGETLPASVVLLSPLVDLAAEGASYETNGERDFAVAKGTALSMGQLYLEGRDPKETPLGSPLYAELHDLPPFYVNVGEAETLLDDATRLVDKIRAAGGTAELEVVDDMQHIYPFFGFLLPEGRTTTENIGRFVRQSVPDPVAGGTEG